MMKKKRENFKAFTSNKFSNFSLLSYLGIGIRGSEVKKKRKKNLGNGSIV